MEYNYSKAKIYPVIHMILRNHSRRQGKESLPDQANAYKANCTKATTPHPPAMPASQHCGDSKLDPEYTTYWKAGVRSVYLVLAQGYVQIFYHNIFL